MTNHTFPEGLGGSSPLAGTAEFARLSLVPAPDRADALEALVIAEFRSALMLADRDDLPLDESFFDLGLSSLRLVEVKDRLESLLGRTISANALFNRPTVERLLEYLRERVLADLFAAPAPEPPGLEASYA